MSNPGTSTAKKNHPPNHRSYTRSSRPGCSRGSCPCSPPTSRWGTRRPCRSTRPGRRHRPSRARCWEATKAPCGPPSTPFRKPANQPRRGPTIMRENQQEEWSQLLGPNTDPTRREPVQRPGKQTNLAEAGPGDRTRAGERDGSCAEGNRRALLALASSPSNSTTNARRWRRLPGSAPTGAVSSQSRRPARRSAAEKELGPLGYASEVACPAPDDCWLATSGGLAVHLAPESERNIRRTRRGLPGPDRFRPEDQGVPRRCPTRSRKTPLACRKRRCRSGRKRKATRIGHHRLPPLAASHRGARGTDAGTALPPRRQGARAATRGTPQAGGGAHRVANVRARIPAACVASRP